MKTVLQNKSLFLQILIWLLLIVVGGMLLMGGWSFFPDKSSVASLKWLQFLQTILVFIVPSYVLVMLIDEHPCGWLHLNRAPSWANVGLAMVIMLLASPAINLLSYLNQQLTLPEFLQPLEDLMRQMEDAAAELTERFVHADNVWVLLLNLGLMAILPGFAEELTFRGVLQGLFTPVRGTDAAVHKTPHVAIWLSAFVFSFIHFQFYGFVPRMLLGAMFGYVFAWSGVLWLPMIMHAINNSVAVFSYYIADHTSIKSEFFDTLGTGDTLWLGITSLVLTIGLLWLFWYVNIQKPQKSKS